MMPAFIFSFDFSSLIRIKNLKISIDKNSSASRAFVDTNAVFLVGDLPNPLKFVKIQIATHSNS